MTNTLPSNSPIFIFPFQKELSPNQREAIISRSIQFLDQWKSHGSDLSTQVWIEENQFLIFAVDPSISEPSGCSKDKLYHFVESFNDSHEIRLGENNKFWIKKDTEIQNFTKKELKENLENESLSFDNQVFPLWITDLQQYNDQWGNSLDSFKTLLKLEEKKTIFHG